MFRKRTARRRRQFLIDSNQNRKKKPKKLRNRSLNFLAKILFLPQLLKLFRVSFFFTLLFVGMAGFILFAIFSPYFNLKKITIVRDNPNINIEQIEQSLSEFYGKNLLFLSHEEMKTVLFENFLEFREVEMSEKWPSELNIKIKISPPVFNLFNAETANFSVVSEDGVILSEKPKEELDVLKIQSYEKVLKPGQKFTTKDVLENIQMAKMLFEQELKIPVKEVLYFPTAREFHIVSEKGTAFWIDLQLKISSQIRKLELASNEIGLFSKKLQHVDLRIPNQIYWE